jgi:hypothetical protein
MKRLKGPELKMPSVKVPPVLADVYWDLRDRRLLPLVALVVVAIAAVPFVLGGGPEEAGPPPIDAGASPLEVAEESSLTVVEANPGLRDYRKRLAARTPTDPFKQRYTQVNLAGAQLNPQTEGSESSSGDTGTVTATSGGSGGETESPGAESKPSPTESSPSPGGSSPDKGDEGTSGELTLYTFAAKVRIAKSGGKDQAKEEPVVRERVLPLTALPGEKAPVVTYMGSSKKGKPLLLVSTDVKSTFGDAKCISGDDVCQLLEVEPGFPTTFVYGYNEIHYTVNVLKIFPVVAGKPRSNP